uniref:3'-phosphate/5'-hydroxy nucleic acid ligase n=1 Tax=Siphoviridae sp. ctRCE13 TaxID=2826332 RepID=A0A8S5QQJ0_9CAUD|nr:MAG TPA: tRNA-splicing ligase RtcB [Siphoviridae sp. ctRCE13]
MKDLKIFTTNIEQEAVNQINELLKQEPFKNCKVRVMPDVHAGKGCVIGFTADLGEKVIPNIVGVDIGCGMLCVELGNVELDFKDLDRVVNEYIPAGRNIRKQKLLNFDKINELYCLRELKETKKFNRAIGTLGGGNHFIEIDVDNKGNKYLVIHTGSRNLGKQVADYYQNLAIELCSGKEEMYKKKEEIIKKYKEQGRKSEIQQALKELEKEYKNDKPNLPKELCYLEGKHREMYLHDMKICQEYASLNRLQIAKQIIINYYKLTYVPETYPPIMQNSFETIHNYISFEDNIVRKGAIRANKNEKVLIPINMRDGSIIAVGKGNQDWNCSAPHGAGRIMSRTKAKEKLKLEEFKQSMKDIYSTSVVEETIDESPMVYKSMQEIIENTKDTIEIQKIIRPIYNFKAKN